MPRWCLLAGAFLLLTTVRPHPPRIAAPGLVLWAWERPEDLRFIDPANTAVAYLAATVHIDSEGAVRFHFRQQPLSTPPGTVRIAVVRIETPTRYVFPAPDRLADRLIAATSQRGVSAIQIDFDARGSERQFYRALLESLRARTPLPLGITALVSWCEGDHWIPGSLVSEAVPMFFRMGRGESRSAAAAATICRSSMGVSTDEEWPGLARGARVYVFNPRPWTRADYELALKRLRFRT